MIYPYLSVKEVRIPASLKTIIKHHLGSKIFINRKSPEKYFKNVTLYFLTIDEYTVFPAYAYNDIVDKTFPKFAEKSLHQNNILAMVQNLIELEWNFVIESRQRMQLPESGDQINITENAISILNELNRLLKIKKKFISETEIRINPKSSPTIENKKSKVLTEFQILISGNLQEKKQIIDLLISNRIKELSKPMFSFLPIRLLPGRKITQRKINIMINSVTFIQSVEDLSHLFKKRVCNVVWHYMHAEMGWKGKKKTLDENQGEFIYTILLLFNLMGPEDLNRHHSPRKKTNYIWTFFKTDDEIILPTFPDINISEYEPEIHVINRHYKRKKMKAGKQDIETKICY